MPLKRSTGEVETGGYTHGMTPSPLWQQAAAFAGRVHGSQVRKDGATPYFSHPVRVALTLSCVFGESDEEVLAAALLHDVIEDCDTDYDDLHERFGATVADLVACVSKDMRMIEPEREEAYDRQLAADTRRSDTEHDGRSAEPIGREPDGMAAERKRRGRRYDHLHLRLQKGRGIQHLLPDAL